MSDFGMFESDEAAANEPRLAAKTAARHLEAAIDTVRAQFGRFLLGATGIDEFGDRWHYSKHDIRATVEPYVFPNTGTMRRIQNAMKADWKLAHPYKLAEDRDAPFQDIDETYHPSSGNLIPEGNFESYKDSVDQGGPEKVESNDFTPGGDSGKHARRRTAGEFYEDDFDPTSPIDQGLRAYDEHQAEHGDMYYGPGKSGPKFSEEYLRRHPERFPHGIGVEAARLVAEIYTDFARSNGLRVASMNSLNAYASTGIADADYRILANLIRIAEEEKAEEADSDDSEGDDTEDYDFGGESDAEDEDEASEDDEADEDGDGDHDDDDHHTEEDSDEEYDFGGDEGGDEQGGGEQYTVPEQAPELSPEMMGEIPQDDPGGSAPVPPEVIDSLLGLPEGTIEQLLLEEVEQAAQGGGEEGLSGAPMPPQGDPAQGAPQGGGDDFFGGGGDDAEQEPPRVARRRTAATCQHCDVDLKKDDGDWVDKHTGDEYCEQMSGDGPTDRRHTPSQDGRQARRRQSARSFWAAEGDPEQESEGGGGEQQAAPAQDPAAAMGGGDPAAMGMQQPMMPPPGSGAVAPPQAPAPLENQPAEDALLDTANQAIMQMIDQETAEYQQIIAPLSQALQAVQMAQQVEQAEHPMDVTPPQGTVDATPSAAPGGAANPMQQQAMRRWAGEHSAPPGAGEDNVHGEFTDWPGSIYQDRIWNMMGEHGIEPDGRNYRHHQDRHGYEASRRRQAKKVRTLKNAAHLIARTYGVSERMLVEAMGRRHYEHVAEAFHILPPQALRSPEVQAAALHIANMFAAENTMFNKNAFMQSVIGPASGSRLPFDRPRTAGETWKNTSTMDIYEHRGAGVQPEITDNMPINDLPDVPGASKHSALTPRQADLMTKLRGWMQRQQDAGNNRGGDAMADQYLSEHPKIGPRGSGQVHQVFNADPHAPGDKAPPKVPEVPVLKAKNPVTKRGKFINEDGGYHTRDDDDPEHVFTNPRNGEKYMVQHRDGTLFRPGDELTNFRGDKDVLKGIAKYPDYNSEGKLSVGDGYGPAYYPKNYDAEIVPYTGGWDPDGDQDPMDPRLIGAGRRDASWGEWEPTKQASFFTRKVPGWRWDDHLSGYLSKEARAFTCSCGEKIASPSYKTCSCGKVWNVYAIGDSHHLASDTADVYIAREIPVRPGVIMANKKMAGDGMSYEDAMAHIDQALADGESDDDPNTLRVGHEYESHPQGQDFCTSESEDGELCGLPESAHPDFNYQSQIMTDPSLINQGRGPVHRAQASHAELVAMIDKLADWTKYDGPDPINDMGKSKPASTSVPKPPKDWATRLPKGDPSKKGGTWTPPTIPRSKK